MKKCAICGEEFEPPDVKDCTGKQIETDICGTCAQILIDDEEAYQQQKKFEEDQANKEAYEEALAEEHFDTGGGWRYV